MSSRATRLKFKSPKRKVEDVESDTVEKKVKREEKVEPQPKFSFHDYYMIEAEDPEVVIESSKEVSIEPDREVSEPVNDKEEAVTANPPVIPKNEPKLRSEYDVPYEFGDSGSSWRMMKLNNIYRTAQESKKVPEIVALERYGNLLDFDIAREEKKEMEDRKVPGHIFKLKPNGFFYHQREFEGEEQVDETDTAAAVEITQSELNELKAKVLRAKIQQAPNYHDLEKEYNEKESQFKSQKLKKVSDNTTDPPADQSIQAMLKEEMSYKDNKDLIKQSVKAIMNNPKFSADLDEQDENMSSLAQNIKKGKVKLSNDLSKMIQQNKILERCSLCQENNKPIPIIELSDKFYLAILPQPSIVEHATMIVPLEHHSNSLNFSMSEVSELERIMICLSRFYYQKFNKKVIFYETNNNYGLHCSIMATPLPVSLDDSLIFEYFKNAILEESNDLDQQHRIWFDTREKSYSNYISEEAPFFHLWITMSGGIAHIIEEDTWPKGDLFARRVIGGILKLDKFDVERKTKYYNHDTDKLVSSFKKMFNDYSWVSL